MPLALSVLARRAIWAARVPKLFSDWIEIANDTADPIQVELGDARWIQIATAGSYKGHHSGPFEMTSAVFEEISRNFHRHPSFKQGPGGYGVADVIPFDWRHASEKSPAEGGALAIVTQAAQGWATDLQVRTIPVAAKDGTGRPTIDTRPTLWALGRMLEPAKTMIKEGRIKWTSVAIWPDTPDPVTGENMGTYLSSIALTNDPFIQGMYAIAADRSAAPVLASSRWIDPYDMPTTASGVLERLRRIFGLAEMADLGEVLRQIATLRAAALGTMAAPPGVDIPELVGALRCLFNLPTLETVERVFEEADKLVAAIASEQAAKNAPARQPASPAPATNTIPPPIAAARAPNTNQDPKETIIMKELIALLAAAFRCSPTEEAVFAEAKQMLTLDRNVDLKMLFGMAGGDGGDAAKAYEKIKSLIAAAAPYMTPGAPSNVEEATRALVKQCSEISTLMKVVPELASVLEMSADDEDEDAMGDVMGVMASRGYTAGADGRLALDRDGADHANILLHRRTGGLAQFAKKPAATASATELLAWVTDVKTLLEQRKRARAEFHAEYFTEPEQPANHGHYLLGRLAVGQRDNSATALARGPQARVGQSFAFGGQRPGPAMPDQLPGGPNAPQLPDLAAFSGNRTQRLLAAAAERAGAQWPKLNDDERFAKKRELEALYVSAGHDLTKFDVVSA